MSRPARPRSPSPVAPTREQLDELDALMQRMLALPVHPGEDDAAGKRPEPPAASRAPVLAAAETATVPDGDRDGPTTADDFPDPFSVQAPFAPKVLQEQLAAERVAAAPPRTPEAGVRPVEPPARRERPAVVVRPPVVVRLRNLLLAPLVACNRSFDAITLLLGPLGRWLRGPHGRGLLGWTGVLLFLGAVAWVVLDGMGWTW